MKRQSVLDWNQLSSRLPKLLLELQKCEPYTCGSTNRPPKKAGVYLFSENGKSLYVGRTQKLRARYGNHQRPSSAPHQAAFAFNLALDATDARTKEMRATRAQLTDRQAVKKAFVHAKDRVRQMEFRWVEIEDPNLEAVFEVYASMQLGTTNDFETH
jgi:predicted GIY-YIG superfamily endonuclease